MELFSFIILSVVVHFTAGAYYGKQIQDNWGSAASNGLSGAIYAVDKVTIQLIDFSFVPTGNGDGSAIVMGKGDTYENVKSGGDISNAVTVKQGPLRTYTTEKVMLQLPDGEKISDYGYIAVANIDTMEVYGGASIPQGFVEPAPQVIGTFTFRAHKVRSGEVTIIDDRTIDIKSLRYDGQGPDAYFYVGITDDVVLQDPPYGIIPDENGISDRKATQYSDRDIVLTLPSDISATDLKWLSIFCVDYSHNFGEVTFPADLNVPPYTGEVDIDREGFNCEALSDQLQVSWLITNNSITFELAGNIDRDVDYMSFGLSGSTSTYQMLQADVVVADYREGKEPRAVDYYLTDFAQCAANGGVCPDTSAYNAANDDVTDVSGEITFGITRVRYTRPLATGDASADKEYKADGSEQQIVWAIGPLNTKDEAAKHYTTGRITASKTINFNREVADNCPSFTLTPEVEPPQFKPHHLYGKEGQEVFTVEIGQSASEQGYKALTDLPSWGIAWYINGILIPELHLKRGVSYTFLVAGGNKPAEGSMYHPFYFTDNIKGGYSTNRNGTIYKGMVDGQLREFAVGGYCEWQLTSKAISNLDNGHVYDCFENFKSDMYLNCADNADGYTKFIFTPDSSTPSLLYYQCYTHESLGWRVHVYDELPDKEIVIDGCSLAVKAASVNLLLVVVVSILSLV